MTNRRIFSFLIVMPLIFSGCSEKHIYQEYLKIPDYIWHYQKPLPFTFKISDTISTYNVYLNLRIASLYPYSNIWIVLSKINEKGKTIYTKRFEFTLADDKGKWTGKGLGDIIDNQFIIEENILFDQSGQYTYTFNHDMRVEYLPAVMDIGLLVKKISKN